MFESPLKIETTPGVVHFSIIVPTLNEAARLAQTLSSARVAFGNDSEYIVVDGGSTDSTTEIARASGARVLTTERGRGVQLDHGFRAARGDICVFLHADTVLRPSGKSVIENAIADGAVGGAFSLEFADAQLGFLVRAINLRARLFRNATGDQVIFARTSALREIGGVPPVPLFEDVRLCRKLKHVGKFVILPETVTTSARLWRRTGVVHGILLHWAFRIMHASGVSPYWLARKYPTPRT